MDISTYCEMVECRLIYETWLGYFAEKETCRLLITALKSDGYIAVAQHLPPKDDSQYAIDFLLYNGPFLRCGIQVKSEYYSKSIQPIVQTTIEINKKKNEKFIELTGIPIRYIYYRRVASESYIIANRKVVEEIESIFSLPLLL